MIYLILFYKTKNRVHNFENNQELFRLFNPVLHLLLANTFSNHLQVYNPYQGHFFIILKRVIISGIDQITELIHHTVFVVVIKVKKATNINQMD